MTVDEDEGSAPKSAHRLRRVDDARTLRALAHPSRLALFELLSVHGSMTATQAAEHVDDSPSNCSFHLRQLAKYGLVEEAADVATAGRARPWRVTQIGVSTRQDPDVVDPAFEIAAEALVEGVVHRALDRVRRWQRRRRSASAPWREVGRTSQTVWWVTAAEALELTTQIEALTFRFSERRADPSTRPEGALPVEFIALIHPFDDIQ